MTKILAAAAIAVLAAPYALADAHGGGGSVYELRTYTTNEGKLPNLHARFKNHTMGLFEKHGMKNVAYWIPTDKPNTLIYIIEHASLEQAPKNWRAFATDPEWQEVYTASRADGPIIEGIENVFMTKTEYSP